MWTCHSSWGIFDLWWNIFSKKRSSLWRKYIFFRLYVDLKKKEKKSSFVWVLQVFYALRMTYKSGSYTPPRKTPSRNYISPKNTWPKLHYPEHNTYISLNVHFPEFTLARMLIWQNLHLAEITFPRKLIFQNLHLPKCTFGRNYISPKTYFPEFILNKIYVWSKTHYSVNSFFRNYISSKIHFLETIFQSKNYTMFRLFISNKQSKLFVEIKKRCDNN